MLTMNNNPKMIGCDLQTIFQFIFSLPGKITKPDLNSVILGKAEERRN
jgi:hypothetical protein